MFSSSTSLSTFAAPTFGGVAAAGAVRVNLGQLGDERGEHGPSLARVGEGRVVRRVARALVDASHRLREARLGHERLELGVGAHEGVGLRGEEAVLLARVEVARLHPLGHHEELLEAHVDQHVLVPRRLEEQVRVRRRHLII